MCYPHDYGLSFSSSFSLRTVSLSFISRVELLYFFLKSLEVTLFLMAGRATERMLTMIVSARPRMISPV